MFAYFIGEQNGIVMRGHFQPGLLAEEYDEETTGDAVGNVAADESGHLASKRAYVFDSVRMAIYNHGLMSQAGVSERPLLQGDQRSVAIAVPRVVEVFTNLAVSFFANWASAEAHYKLHKGDRYTKSGSWAWGEREISG